METATEKKPWVSEGITEKDLCNLTKYFRTHILKVEVADFAKKAGIPSYRISNWEAHKVTSTPSDKIGLAAIRKIADAYGYDAEIVLTKK